MARARQRETTNLAGRKPALEELGGKGIVSGCQLNRRRAFPGGSSSPPVVDADGGSSRCGPWPPSIASVARSPGLGQNRSPVRRRRGNDMVSGGGCHGRPILDVLPNPGTTASQGARGGRAYGRNERARRGLAYATGQPACPPLPAPPLTSTAQSIAALDAQFPWVRGARNGCAEQSACAVTRAGRASLTAPAGGP